MTRSNLETAGALFTAIENKDPDAVAALYDDAIEVWHNFSNASQDKAANLQTLTSLCQHVPEIRYEVTERLELDDGRVLQRHVLRARTGQGEDILIPACMLLSIRDGRIVGIHEYLDSGQANRLRAATGRPAIG